MTEIEVNKLTGENKFDRVRLVIEIKLSL